MKNIHILPTSQPSRLGYLTKKGKEVFKDLRFFGRFMPTIMDGENQNVYINSDEDIKEGDWFIFDNDIIQVKGEVHLKYIIKHGYKKIILTTDQELINNGTQKIDDDFLEWFVNNSSCEFVDVEKTMYMPFDGKVAFELSLDESLNTRPYYKIIIPKEEPKQEAQGYICPQTKKQCDDECCVSAEDCHIEQSIGVISDCEPEEEPCDNCDNCNNDICCCIIRTQEILEEAAELNSKKVGHYAGYQDFIEGAKWQQERMYSEEEVRKLFNQYKNHFSIYRNIQILNAEFGEWFEQFKKK